MNTQRETDTSVRLVQRAQFGDHDAFAKLVSPLSPQMLSIAYRVVGNREDAEDIVQESLWKAFEHLPEYRMEAAFSSWLTRITVNQAVGLLRKRRTQPIDQSLDKEGQVEALFACWPAPGITPEEISRLRELRDVIIGGLNQIPRQYRVALSLRALDEWSYREIADSLGVSETTVKTRVHRGRQKLRQVLAQRGMWTAPETAVVSARNPRSTLQPSPRDHERGSNNRGPSRLTLA